MPVFIAMLRGINVSGQKLVKMDALRNLFENRGFENVKTYIQSGNIVFHSNNPNQRDLEQIISAGLKKQFGFDIPVTVLAVEELKKIALNNPFINDDSKDRSYLYVTFLSAEPEMALYEHIKNEQYQGEAFELSGKAIYLYCPKGYGTTRLSNTFLEKKLKVAATTRNWKTVNALMELAAAG
ncbi:MAG: DUF1697 domain-containing protein [Bacteroidales bacterium]|nr:DUF1697 domain-containing protein [Bacteroidales bacterium]